MKNAVLSFTAAVTLLSSTAFAWGQDPGPYREPFGNSDPRAATAEQLGCQSKFEYDSGKWLTLPEYNNVDAINLDVDNIVVMSLLSLARDEQNPEIVRFTFETTTKKPDAGFISRRLKSVYVMTVNAPEVNCGNYYDELDIKSIRLESSKGFIGMDGL
ncbi:MAG: hypothetical protein EOP04_00090 [Proteobacteria bacterium]|nr:MAG: hypothetical protein EOP04_00090 [Pseudomonadota bacterium]